MTLPPVAGGLPAADPLARGTFANARLTEVRAPGALDPYGEPADGAVLWSGSVPAYLTRERRARVGINGLEELVDVDVLVIADVADIPVTEVAGPDWKATTITVTDQRTASDVVTRWRVNAMTHVAVHTRLDHIRLELERLS